MRSFRGMGLNEWPSAGDSTWCIRDAVPLDRDLAFGTSRLLPTRTSRAGQPPIVLHFPPSSRCGTMPAHKLPSIRAPLGHTPTTATTRDSAASFLSAPEYFPAGATLLGCCSTTIDFVERAFVLGIQVAGESYEWRNAVGRRHPATGVSPPHRNCFAARNQHSASANPATLQATDDPRSDGVGRRADQDAPTARHQRLSTFPTQRPSADTGRHDRILQPGVRAEAQPAREG